MWKEGRNDSRLYLGGTCQTVPQPDLTLILSSREATWTAFRTRIGPSRVDISALVLQQMEKKNTCIATNMTIDFSNRNVSSKDAK